MTSVADTKDDVKLYVVLGAPTDPSLDSAYQHAIQILKKVSGQFEQEIYSENEVATLAAKLQEQIAMHNKLAH